LRRLMAERLYQKHCSTFLIPQVTQTNTLMRFMALMRFG
jgi:hypothetical protein